MSYSDVIVRPIKEGDIPRLHKTLKHGSYDSAFRKAAQAQKGDVCEGLIATARNSDEILAFSLLERGLERLHVRLLNGDLSPKGVRAIKYLVAQVHDRLNGEQIEAEYHANALNPPAYHEFINQLGFYAEEEFETSDDLQYYRFVYSRKKMDNQEALRFQERLEAHTGMPWVFCRSADPDYTPFELFHNSRVNLAELLLRSQSPTDESDKLSEAFCSFFNLRSQSSRVYQNKPEYLAVSCGNLEKYCLYKLLP